MKDFIELFKGKNLELFLNVGFKVLLAILIFCICYFIVKAIHRSIDKASKHFKEFDNTLVPILSTGISVIFYSITIIIILDFFGVNTNSIIALLGAASLAIGLALKNTLSNIAAGIMLLILKPFCAGDYIESGSMIGNVKEVGLFTTILETADGLFISSPNSCLWGEPIKNYYKNGKRRMDLIVGISYSDSIDLGFKTLISIFENEPRFLKEHSPVVVVQSMGESSVNLQLRVWTQAEIYWDVYWTCIKKIKEEFDTAGLTIPNNQLDVHLFNEK